jgi:hypothetical protein
VNCNQARAMMTAYRESKNGEVDSLELDVHLEGCASCRQEFAHYMFIGEQIRSMPVVEPPPDMHAKLMHTLAKDQLELIRRSTPGTVYTPEFLKPYLQEYAQSTHTSDLIAAFSTAETGPIPIIQTKRKPRHRSHMSQFAVLGLAAMFLMVLMMGGLTSLLLLVHNNLPGANPSKISSSISQPNVVDQVKYVTGTPYQHVVSAVADHAYIYFTAYGDGAYNSWMLERLDRATKISTPLLLTPSPYPVIALGSANGSLVWLQFDDRKLKPHRNLPGTSVNPYISLWSLHYISPDQQQLAALGIPPSSTILLKGTFDLDTAPGRVTTPIQDIWFLQKSLLVAMTDGNGVSHLMRYQLDTLGKPVATEIATAPPGHILTSPTATSDGTQIYWSEEWLSNAGMFYSNIWTQQVVDNPPPLHRQWLGYKVRDTVKHVFSSDGMSFHPQVVDNTLFMLSTAGQFSSTQGTPATPGTTTSTAATSPITSVITRTDMSIYTAPLDASVRGTILMIPLSGDSDMRSTSMNTSGLASSLQAGTDFALWQADKGYEMYDVQSQSYVNVRDTLNGAAFVAVNEASAVWIVSNATNTTNNANPLVTLMAFNWPAK